MWILLTVIISSSNTEANAPVYLRPILTIQ